MAVVFLKGRFSRLAIMIRFGMGYLFCLMVLLQGAFVMSCLFQGFLMVCF